MPAQLLPWFIAAAGVFGLLIGSFLNVVIWRVPRGESLLPDSHCPNCDQPIRPWQNVPVISWIALRGRCSNCGAPISVRYPLVELGTALAYALVAWWYASAFAYPGGAGGGVVGSAGGGVGVGTEAGPVIVVAWWLGLAAYLWFAAASISLAMIDLDLQRLPDAIVLPALGVMLVLLGTSAALRGDWAQLITVVLAAAAMFAFYFLIVLVYPAGMGGGDVKLAPVLGAAAGFVGWGAVIVGAFAGFAVGAAVGLTVMAVRRVGMKHAIPFGPSMLVGGWIGVTTGEPLMRAYLGFVGL